MKPIQAACLLAAATLLHSIAWAAPRANSETEQVRKQREAWEARFRKADTDHSGGLSRAELRKTEKERFPIIKKHFKAMDRNKDGQVTLKERYDYEKRR